jgi:hypothetical protein
MLPSKIVNWMDYLFLLNALFSKAWPFIICFYGRLKKLIRKLFFLDILFTLTLFVIP